MEKTIKKKKVLVALSGGVDSGVAAALLVAQGYDVTGVHLKLGKVGEVGAVGAVAADNKCCDASSFGRVVALCEQLKIPLKVLDFSEKFADVVIHDFLDNYRRGLTPNPCVVCNKEIKIGGLLAWALANGFEYLATGHYVRVGVGGMGAIGDIRGSGGGKFCLLQAVDKKKDQSYFLWTLESSQIKHLLFPVGEMSKEEVRKIASKLGLPVAGARESFDVCFIGGEERGKDARVARYPFSEAEKRKGGEVGDFLRKRLPAGSFRDGEVVNTAGEVIGRHFGLPLYTIGQHRGFLTTSKKYGGQVLFVIKKDVEKNQLLVGTKEQAAADRFLIGEVRGIGDVGDINGLMVRVRHRGAMVTVKSLSEEVDARLRLATLFTRRKNVSEGLSDCNNKRLEVTLTEPMLGVAPGQSAVFYRGEELVGGGVIVAL